jgi:hypothetical protein
MALLTKLTARLQENRGLPAMSVFLVFVLFVGLGCSAGRLLVRVATPTPTLIKTPRATYTFTPERTATFTPSPTSTVTPTPTPTPTATPTPEAQAEEAEEAAENPAPPAVEAAPVVPTNTPPPEEPTPTPEPDYPFNIVYFVHDTGSQDHTRLTMWVREDFAPGFYNTLDGYQMKAVGPDGSTHLSEVSGAGAGDSTVKGTGDNHNMNAKLEFAPYTPGTYAISLVEGGVQVSPEIEIALSAEPQQYIHFDFAWQK